MWIRGIITAVINEKTVNTSAARVAGRRHSALDNLKIAESITPAWLMPIQKTKLTMKKPHMTGRFKPVIPMPLLIISPAALIAPRTIIAMIATVTQYQLGVVRIDRSKSRLISFAGRTLPSCI